MIETTYKRWLNYPKLESYLLDQLRTYNQQDIYQAFYQDIDFGTAGMRGLLGAGINRINIYSVRKANYGFSKYLLSNYKDGISVVIGYDNRHYSKELALDSARYLSFFGIKVYLYDKLVSTPQLSVSVRYLKCNGGIMITASHNPKEYNGYKLYNEYGSQLMPDIIKKIKDNMNDIDDILNLEYECNESLIEYLNDDIDDIYTDMVLDIRLYPNVDKNINIVYSPLHGASYKAVSSVLKKANYNLIEVKEQVSPDPNFTNTISANPQSVDAYSMVIEYGNRYNGDILLVCDPDGDRMGLSVLHNNEYHLVDGNQTGVLLIKYILDYKKKYNLLKDNMVIYSTIVTSPLGTLLATHYNIKTVNTLTGFKYISNLIRELEIDNKLDLYILGYEESYGSLINTNVRDKDATQACLLLSEACAYYKSLGMTLIDVLDTIYADIGYYYNHMDTIELDALSGEELLNDLMNKFRDYLNIDFGNNTIDIYIDYLSLTMVKDSVKSLVDESLCANVIKYIFKDGSFIAIRPSGTEPQCKIYYSIYGKNKDIAYQQYNIFNKYINKMINE